MARKRTAALVFVSVVALASFNHQRIPKAIAAYNYNLGVKNLKAGRNREAAAAFPLHFLGNSYGYLGRWEESIEVYRRLLALQPDYEDAHYQLGAALFYTKQYRDAVASYRRALELNADDRRAVYGLALAHHALGERRSAEAYRERLKSLDPWAAAELAERMNGGTAAGRR